MYGCERMLFFQRVHGGSQNGEQSEVNLIEICQSGTDRHLDVYKRQVGKNVDKRFAINSMVGAVKALML